MSVIRLWIGLLSTSVAIVAATGQKISQYPATTALGTNDLLIVAYWNGTDWLTNKYITSTNLISQVLSLTSSKFYVNGVLVNLPNLNGPQFSAVATNVYLSATLLSTNNGSFQNTVNLGSGTSFVLDPLIDSYTATASGNFTFSLATNTISDTARESPTIRVYVYDAAGSKTASLSSSGTGGTAFANAEKQFGWGTNSVSAGTNGYTFVYQGGVWHAGQDTAQISAVQVGSGAVSDTEFARLDGLSGTIATSADDLSFFAATTSAQFFSAISDESGNAGVVPRFSLTGSAQGDVVYYNGATWVNLAPGTSGQFLKTQGVAANPVWATAAVTDNWTASGTTNSTLAGNATLNGIVVTNTATIPALYGRDGTTRLNVAYTVYAAGTAYQMTATSGALTFGTTSPSVTLSAPGTYSIRARVHVKYNAATFAANRTLTLKLRRTNNTAADVTNASDTFTTAIVTTVTDELMDARIPEVIYTTSNSNDAIALYGDISVVPSAGSLDATAANIVAVRLYE